MKLKYISWIPSAAIMIIIFWFSSRTADTSNESSMNIADSLLTTYETVTGVAYEEPVREERLGSINHFIRKSAHFSEYALLSCSFMLHLLVLHKRGRQLVLPPVLLSAAYAVTDEFHQTMISGRGGMLSDVLLDTCGAAAGAIIFHLILQLFRKVRKSKPA